MQAKSGLYVGKYPANVDTTRQIIDKKRAKKIKKGVRGTPRSDSTKTTPRQPNQDY